MCHSGTRIGRTKAIESALKASKKVALPITIRATTNQLDVGTCSIRAIRSAEVCSVSKAGEDETSAIGELGEAIGRVDVFAEIPKLMAKALADGLSLEGGGEGLSIGASAASGATAVAAALIVGFALHNATEGFGVAAPLVGRVVPTWGQILLAGLIAGGPTFIGTIVASKTNDFFIAAIVGAIAGGLIGLLLAFFAVRYLVDQIIVGIVIVTGISFFSSSAFSRYSGTSDCTTSP